MSTDRPGYALPLLLLQGFRMLTDELHDELARRGHPDIRPVHGFVLQAISADASTAVELGQRLGVSKQAAGKHVDLLERLGYVVRRGDPADARRKVITLTEHGYDCLRRSAEVFDELRARWVAVLGEERLRAIEDDLGAMTVEMPVRVDVPGWFSAPEGAEQSAPTVRRPGAARYGRDCPAPS